MASQLSPLAVFAATYVGAHAVWSASHAVLLHAHKAAEAAAVADGSSKRRAGGRHDALRARALAALAPFYEDEFTRRRTGNYVLSLIHSTVTSLVSLVLVARHGLPTAATAAVFKDEALLGAAPGTAPLAPSARLLAFSVAYFAHDLISTLPDWGRNPADIAHHVAGVVLTASPLVSAPATALGHHLLVTELSTPLLNSMWFLRKAGAEGGRAYKAAAALFVAAFFVTRLLYLPVLTYCVLAYAGGHLLATAPHLPVLLLALSGLNVWWWGKIVAMLRKGKADPPPTHLSEAELRARSAAAAAAAAADGDGTEGPASDGAAVRGAARQRRRGARG
jgi:hypothetical protein